VPVATNLATADLIIAALMREKACESARPAV
jgi:methylglyoxal synthase